MSGSVSLRGHVAFGRCASFGGLASPGDHHLAAAIYLSWTTTGRFGTASRRTRAKTKECGESIAHDPQRPEIAASIGLAGKKLPVFGLHRRFDVASNHHACWGKARVEHRPR